MSPEQIKAMYPKYAGWNDLASIQGDYNAGHAGNPGPSFGGAPDYTALASQMLEQQKQANAPLVANLGSQIPTIQQSYATKGSALQSQMQPLQQRYESALGALTAGSATDVNAAQTSAAREFGARGVPLSSSAYDQYLQKQTLPIQSSYAGNYGQLQGQEAQDVLGLQNQIAGLPVQQQQDIGQLNQAIAQLQAGGNQTAIQSALSMYQLQQQAQQQAAQLALQQQLLPYQQQYYSRFNTSPYYDARAQLAAAQAQTAENKLNRPAGAGGGGGYVLDYNGNLVPSGGGGGLPPLSSFIG